MSQLGYQLAVHVAPHIDKVLIPRTNGRLSSAGVDRAGLVTSTGAKTGQQRSTPLVLVEESDGLLAIASNYGGPKHPGWSANLKANPECTVQYKGPPRKYRASLLTGDERAAAWDTAVDFYAGYDAYRAKAAPREIRVFRLRPVDG